MLQSAVTVLTQILMCINHILLQVQTIYILLRLNDIINNKTVEVQPRPK